jgi:hypothetical protein
MLPELDNTARGCFFLASHTFDRVSRTCRVCQLPAVITAAYLSLTRVGLEASCPGCGEVVVKMFDLLEIDLALQAEHDT